MESFVRDLKMSVRALLRSRSFTSIAVLTLTLGIGATTTIFSVVNAVVLSPLPYADADNLVHIRTELTNGQETTGGFSPYAMDRLNEEGLSFEHIVGAYQFDNSVLHQNLWVGVG